MKPMTVEIDGHGNMTYYPREKKPITFAQWMEERWGNNWKLRIGDNHIELLRMGWEAGLASGYREVGVAVVFDSPGSDVDWYDGCPGHGVKLYVKE